MSTSETTPVSQKKNRKAHPRLESSLPVLEKLAALYPQLFGATFLPLKRGIFQDLLAAHTDAFDKDGLKAALAAHTRSTRYLIALADGKMRHDLLGQAVEVLAPEHTHHALIEVFRRRQSRTQDNLKPLLLQRVVQTLETSGLAPDVYAERVRTRDEAANALLDEALALARERTARAEALLRAFSASGQTIEAFSDMYGLNPQETRLQLERARTSQVLVS